MSVNMILALDPGRDKTGFAFTDFQGKLLASGIFAASERDNFFRSLNNMANISRWILEGSSENLADTASVIKFIALGDGTTSMEFSDYVRGVMTHHEIITVDERNTTLEARCLYWKLHRPGGFMRLLPEGLRVPPRILDDLAAWAIALRALRDSHEKI